MSGFLAAIGCFGIIWFAQRAERLQMNFFSLTLLVGLVSFWLYVWITL